MYYNTSLFAHISANKKEKLIDAIIAYLEVKTAAEMLKQVKENISEKPSSD